WAKPYPMMRHPNAGDATGKTHSWTILRADMPLTLENLKRAPKYRELTPELEGLSIHSLWSHDLLVRRLAREWTPARAQDLRPKDIKEELQENPPPPQPAAAANQSLQHYLYFSEKTNAEEAARWFRSQGFLVDVRLGADRDNWLALVKHEIPADQEDLERLR